MTTRIPVTLEGNLTDDPAPGVGNNGIEYARFSLAVNDRQFNRETQLWEDIGTVYHRVVVFSQLSRHVAGSLRKGDNVVIAGEMRFGSYVDKETGQRRESRDIIADNVGASLKFTDVNVQRAPKAMSPEADNSGPIRTPDSYSGAGVAR